MSPHEDPASCAARFAGARCVVTGGLGFIGSNLALALAAAGANVRVIDALIPSHGGNRHNIAPAANDIDVVTSETQLVTNSARLFI